MNVEERYNNVLEDNDLNHPLDTYDAIDAVELLMMLEEEFKIRLDDDKIVDFKTHNDFINYIKELV